MKIFILPVSKLLQPQKQSFKYPSHNKDYGVEQDFLIWLRKQKHLITEDAATADWHYLPVYWTRWHINHHFAENDEGIDELQTFVNEIIIDDNKTFTITQFDGGTLVNCGNTTVFTAARTTNTGIDIPILCSAHRKPPLPVAKKYVASFNGAFYTHPIRSEMQKKMAGNKHVLIGDSLPTRFYKRWFWATNYNLNTMASYIALCPRGTSANSFRFFEAMQLGTVPCLIGDMDVRPFKNFIPWDEISYYVSSVDELEELLQTIDKKAAIAKGKAAYQYWKNELYYQKWCKYIIKELESIS
ncbi:MAG: exostosin domain-containing protein [Mucilaginibacter sp.]